MQSASSGSSFHCHIHCFTCDTIACLEYFVGIWTLIACCVCAILRKYLQKYECFFVPSPAFASGPISHNLRTSPHTAAGKACSLTRWDPFLRRRARSFLSAAARGPLNDDPAHIQLRLACHKSRSKHIPNDHRDRLNPTVPVHSSSLSIMMIMMLPVPRSESESQ